MEWDVTSFKPGPGRGGDDGSIFWEESKTFLKRILMLIKGKKGKSHVRLVM